jgi:hypothetical protein
VHITDITADYDGDIGPVLADPNLSDLAKLTGPGILSHSHLQGFQSAISSAIKLPTTIIEFAPDGEPVRTDSPFLQRTMNSACLTFRAGCDCCEPTDIAHARLFHHRDAYKSLNQLTANAEEVREREHLQGLPYGTDLTAHQHEPSGRVYLTYDCPNVGYRECVFPIVFDGRLLGVFFAGQIILESRLTEIADQIQDLPNRIPSNLLCSNVTASALASEVKQKHVDWASSPDHVFSSDQFDALITNVCDQLSRLEKQLGENLDRQKKIYVTAHIREIMGTFRTGLPHDIVDSRETLDKLWTCAQTAFLSIAEAFSLRYIVLFGVKQVAVTRVQTLHVVASAGDSPPEFTTEEPKPTLNLKIVEDIVTARSGDMENGFIYASNNENSEFLTALESCYRQQCGNFELVLLPVPLHPQSSIGLLLGYPKNYPRAAPDNRHTDDLINALETFGSLLASSVSAALGGIAQKITYDQLKILGHESSQLITGIDLMRDTYLQDYNTIRALSQEKAEDICRDFTAFTQNLDYLFISVKSLLFETLPYEPEEFFVGRDILFKWKEFNRLETRRKDIQIQIPGISKYPTAANTPVWGDKILFEQLLYNLLNNAVKYAHRGTTIHLDYGLASGAWNAPHRLVVTDYGIEMRNDPHVYELYHRMNDKTEGLGVGLFLCKRIADVHGGKIEHNCDLISCFNVPLVTPFLMACEGGQCTWADPKLIDDVRRELGRIETHLKDVVATRFHSGEPLYKPNPHEITREDLCQPTYRVTAWVELPRRRREKRK